MFYTIKVLIVSQQQYKHSSIKWKENWKYMKLQGAVLFNKKNQDDHLVWYT